jgi:hypothetical protein
MPKPFRKTIETIVRKKRVMGDKNPAVYFKDAKATKTKIKKMTNVTAEDVNRFKSKTNFTKLDEITKTIKAEAKKRLGNSTLVQIKDNIRDSRALNIPNSLPRRSSVLGIINAFKKQGLNQFAIAVTDVKTGKLMGYTVIRIPARSEKAIKKRFNFDLEKSEASFNSYIDNFIGKSEHPELYYEEALKEFFGFQIKHLTMPGYRLDPLTRDFKEATSAEMSSRERNTFEKEKRIAAIKNKIEEIKTKARGAAERIDATSLHPKLKKNRQ